MSAPDTRGSGADVTAAAPVRIDIWSDVVCPWCYLGVHRFLQALDELSGPSGPPGDTGAPNAGFEVHLHAFELDPHAPREPQPLRPVLERKYGAGAFDAMTERLTRLGDAAGIDYRFDRTLRVNTRDAHRLLAWATETDPPRTFPLARALFEAYFTEGRNLVEVDTLVEAAAAAGLDADAARVAIESGSHRAAVEADEERARELGITGVPAFVVDGDFVIPGAQEVDTFVRLLGTRRDRSA